MQSSQSGRWSKTRTHTCTRGCGYASSPTLPSSGNRRSSTRQRICLGENPSFESAPRSGRLKGWVNYFYTSIRIPYWSVLVSNECVPINTRLQAFGDIADPGELECLRIEVQARAGRLTTVEVREWKNAQTWCNSKTVMLPYSTQPQGYNRQPRTSPTTKRGEGSRGTPPALKSTCRNTAVRAFVRARYMLRLEMPMPRPGLP